MSGPQTYENFACPLRFIPTRLRRRTCYAVFPRGGLCPRTLIRGTHPATAHARSRMLRACLSAQRRSAAAADPAAVVTAAGLEPALTSPLMPCSSCYTTPSCYRAACPKLPGPSLRLSPSFRLSPVLSGQPAISMPCDPREMICRRGRCRHRPTLVSLAACPICQKGGNYGGAWHVAPWWIAPESNRVNHGVNHGDGFLIGCANLRTVPVIDALIDGSLTPRSI